MIKTTKTKKDKNMKRFRLKAIFPFLLLILAALLFTACEKQDPPEPVGINTVMIAGNGVTGYRIVRADAADKPIMSACPMLKRAIDAAAGCEITLGTDFDPEIENEILIGKTKRSESAKAAEMLGDNDFIITWIGKKLVIVGKDDAKTIAGVRYFAQNFCGYYSAYDHKKMESIALPENYCYAEVINMTAADPRNSSDVLVYVNTVYDFGAVGDGSADDTKAFQSALDDAEAKGGGTVYAPAGQYLIKGSLKIGTSVYLAGAWSDPDIDPEGMHKGTVLLAVGNQGKEDNEKALITIGASAGVLGITVYYPNQSEENPVAYPPAIRIRDSIAGNGSQHASSIQNLTVVNGWKAVEATEGLQLPTIKDVRVSALSSGFAINGCYDCARIISFRVSPSYWAAYEGKNISEIADAMKKSTTAFTIMRTDAQMMYDLTAESCKTGISLLRDPTNNGETAGGTSIEKLKIENCNVGIIHDYNSCSISDAEINVTGNGAVCVVMTNDTARTSSLRLYGVSFRNQDGSVIAVQDSAEGVLTVQDSVLEAWNGTAVKAEGGVLSFVGNKFVGSGNAVSIGKNVRAAAVTDNFFASGVQNTVSSSLSDSSFTMEHSIKEPSPHTSFEIELPVPPVISNGKIFDVTEYGAKKDGKNDDTEAFRKAIDAAGAAGGGIVWVPGGYYNVKSSLTLPTGVELRGVSECIHVSSGEGTVIYITDGKGDADGTSFLTMKEGSGVRGLTFWYPEQAWNDVKAYPFAIRVTGKNCSIRNICLGNCYRGIDMSGCDCGGHYVENNTGTILNKGIVLDGSRSAGSVIGTHFNLTFYYNVGTKAKLSDASGDFGYGMAVPVMQYLNANMTAYEFGETKDELLLFVFNYRARYGMVFSGGFDGKVIGCGVDGSLCGVKITGSYSNDLCLLSFSDDIVPGSTPEGNVGIYVDVDEDSTVRFVSGGASSYNYVPSDLVILKNGNLILDGFHANVTPASGNGAIRVSKGFAKVSGIVFSHVGPLDNNGAFTKQSKSENTVDIVVEKNGGIELRSAVGLRFFTYKYNGEADSFHYVISE